MWNLVTYSKTKMSLSWLAYLYQSTFLHGEHSSFLFFIFLTFIIFKKHFVLPDITTKYRYILKPNAFQHDTHEAHLATEIN